MVDVFEYLAARKWFAAKLILNLQPGATFVLVGTWIYKSVCSGNLARET